MKHQWERAHRARQKMGISYVVLSEPQAVISCQGDGGWIVTTPKQSIQAKTPHGVKLVLQELELPVSGWK